MFNDESEIILIEKGLVKWLALIRLTHWTATRVMKLK
jgi:hypothetical protein